MRIYHNRIVSVIMMDLIAVRQGPGNGAARLPAAPSCRAESDSESQPFA
jgi:hypothetical protein